MKKLVFAFVALAVFMASCKKDEALNLATDNGCIERANVPANVHIIKSADAIIADALFRNNNIDNSKYRYFRYHHDSVQTYFPPYAKFDQKIVGVYEYINGLPMFTGGLIFQFKNDAFSFRNGTPTAGTKLNTKPKLNLGQLRKLFVNDAERFEHKGLQFKDSCFKAEFGYYNLNAGISNAAENLIKAWRITPKNSVYPSEYPLAFYQDDNGELIYYDNGIRTFK